jgi:transketolase
MSTPSSASPSQNLVSAKELRRLILVQSRRANVGHIGSALCVADILSVLYGRVLRLGSPEDIDRDRFILSKGHAALALYAALHLRGWLSYDDLQTYCGSPTHFGVHPERQTRGVDFSTGSLGQGLSMGVGAALAARLQGSARRVFCLLSDAECNEGSVWEAMMFAAQHRLGNLSVIIDFNGQQAFGLLSEVLDQSNLPERWRSFGWDVADVDGHDLDQLAAKLQARPAPSAPQVVIARTTFGKGVSFMEQGISRTQTHVPRHMINWHYLPMSPQEYEQAMNELETAL